MARVSKFTDEQKLHIALDLLGGKLSHAEICRKYDISSTYAYKLKDRAVDILREDIGWLAGQRHGQTEQVVLVPLVDQPQRLGVTAFDPP
jgi:hypothetical protein